MTATTSPEEARIKQALGHALDREPAELADTIELASLIAESFALVETVINIQEDLNIRLVQEDLRDVKTVGELVEACAKHL